MGKILSPKTNPIGEFILLISSKATKHSRPVTSQDDCDIPISPQVINRHQNRLFVLSIADEIVNEKLVNQHTDQDEFKQEEDMHFGIPFLKHEFIETLMPPIRQREKPMNQHFEADRKNHEAPLPLSIQVPCLLAPAEGVPSMP